MHLLSWFMSCDYFETAYDYLETVLKWFAFSHQAILKLMIPITIYIPVVNGLQQLLTEICIKYMIQDVLQCV